jgi:ATP-binding protein involved in chromosome partitioning
MPYVPSRSADLDRIRGIFARIAAPSVRADKFITMAPLASAEFRALVEKYQDPYLGQSLGTALAVESAEVKGDRAHVRVALGFPVGGYQEEFTRGLAGHLAAGGGPSDVVVELTARITAHAVQRQLSPQSGIKNIVAVASGKGGVGKSTVAANLALAWARQGAKVGILDADIYGPSQPIMLGLTGQRPASPDGKRIKPLQAHGLSAMSIGFLIDPEQPMVWRGPMVTQALTQLLGDTDWGDLDYLVIDMPPGTGDIQLTLAQRVPVAGAVIVTTPQDIALADARKGLKMFEKVNVPVLGIVENMSVHVCSNCGHVEHLFGSGGGARMAAQYGVELLGELPLDVRVREEADGGVPTVAAQPDAAHAAPYFAMARRTAAALSRRAKDRSNLFPKIVVEET